MLAIGLRRDPYMRTPLSRIFITQASKRGLQLCTAHVAGQLHAVSTSSRTKCSRMSFGRGMVSSK